jgi:hypothetical protein
LSQRKRKNTSKQLNNHKQKQKKMATKTSTIAVALLAAQSEMGNAKKGSDNPYFKSKYADLNAIREVAIPVLNRHGIVVLQPTVHIDGRNFVKTLLLHESGESLESFTEILFAKPNDAQSQGSGITYARRYGLQSFVNIGADDDDGNAASNPTTPVSDKKWLNLIERDGSPNQAVLARLQTFFNEGKSLDELEQKVKISQKDREYIVNLFNIG